jgi:dihydroneopterin aldolase
MLINNSKNYEQITERIKSILHAKKTEDVESLLRELSENGITKDMLNTLQISIKEDIKNGTHNSLAIFRKCLVKDLDGADSIACEILKQ